MRIGGGGRFQSNSIWGRGVHVQFNWVGCQFNLGVHNINSIRRVLYLIWFEGEGVQHNSIGRGEGLA